MPERVRVLGRLTPLHIPVSGYLLHPVVGIVDERPDFRIAEWEVARLLEVPLARLGDRSHRQARDAHAANTTARSFQFNWPYFDLDGEKVWGATAMALAEFMAMVDERRQTDARRLISCRLSALGYQRVRHSALWTLTAPHKHEHSARGTRARAFEERGCDERAH